MDVTLSHGMSCGALVMYHDNVKNLCEYKRVLLTKLIRMQELRMLEVRS